MTEYFQTYHEDGTPAELIERAIVHATGLWHKSVNIFLFDELDRLYLQKRTATKDVWPNTWDVSAAEHLIPGESYEDAAIRGVQEELGIQDIELTAWGDAYSYKTVDEENGIHDYEFQQCFRGVYSGLITIQREEVAQIRLCTLRELSQELKTSTESFTPWLRHALHYLHLLD